MKTLKFSKDKFEAIIENHFEGYAVYDYTENPNRDIFKIWFEETICGITYQFDFQYSPNYENIYYEDEITCTTENKPVELALKVTNFNPNKPTLSENIQNIIEKQIQRNEENNDRLKQEARDVEETNEILNQKYR